MNSPRRFGFFFPDPTLDFVRLVVSTRYALGAKYRSLGGAAEGGEAAPLFFMRDSFGRSLAASVCLEKKWGRLAHSTAAPRVHRGFSMGVVAEPGGDEHLDRSSLALADSIILFESVLQQSARMISGPRTPLLAPISFRNNRTQASLLGLASPCERRRQKQ